MIGMLNQKFMIETKDELMLVKDPHIKNWMQDNFSAIVIERVNTVLQYANKKEIALDEKERLTEAVSAVTEGYSRYLESRLQKKKERELKKAERTLEWRGENQ